MKLIIEAPEIISATREGTGVRLTWRNKEKPENYHEIDIWCNGSTSKIVGKNEDGTVPESVLLEAPVQDDPSAPFVPGTEYKFQVLAYGPSDRARLEFDKYNTNPEDTMQDGVSTEFSMSF